MLAPTSPVSVELLSSSLSWQVLYTRLHVNKPVCVFLKITRISTSPTQVIFSHRLYFLKLGMRCLEITLFL